MIFTLNGGPGDGKKVEVGGKCSDGRFVRFTYVENGEKFLYVCPSEEDFTMRQLFLCDTSLPIGSADLDMRDAMRKKPKKTPISKEAALAAEKKYRSYHTSVMEHHPVSQKKQQPRKPQQM